MDIQRLVLKDPSNLVKGERVVHYSPSQIPDATSSNRFTDPSDGAELEILERVSFIEWIATNYSSYGTRLEFVTDKSQEGNQFVKGFGGIGGILRFKLDLTTLDGEVGTDHGSDDGDGDFI